MPEKRIVNCVFAATSANGSPDFSFVKVACTQDQFDLGLHYDAVKLWAVDNDYEGPFVIFDEEEAPAWLLERFVWESASVVEVPEEPAE